MTRCSGVADDVRRTEVVVGRLVCVAVDPERRLPLGDERFDHAALVMEIGGEWVTTDRDFSRFPGLKWRHPLD